LGLGVREYKGGDLRIYYYRGAKQAKDTLWGRYTVTVYSVRGVLELGIRWYTVVYILDVYIECLPRMS
jgi:hypothetical protein